MERGENEKSERPHRGGKLEEIYARRAELKSRKDDLIKYLTKCRINSSSSLVDKEGFPRTDIDIPGIIKKRKILSEIEYDLGELDKEIETFIISNFADIRRNSISEECHVTRSRLIPTSRRDPDGSDPYLKEEPFAIIQNSIDNSPAFLAGLISDDLILRFGHYTIENLPPITEIGDFVKSQKNKPISVLIRRQSEHYWTRIVPQEFDKPGLLGFTMAYLKARKRSSK